MDRARRILCAAVLLGATPVHADAFWDHWGDGKAEIAAYDLTYPRYGAPRSGTAIAIFVTETYAPAAGVKSEDPRRKPADTVPVMKLNLVQDFPTGVYDYNLMTSAFVSLGAAAGVPARKTLRVSFSAQDWCGQAYAAARLEGPDVRLLSHSYFDGEADETATLPAREGGLVEDALLLWARGLVEPVLEPGLAVEVPLLRSLELSRLAHVRVAWDTARVRRSAGTRRVTVPAGEIEVEELTVAVAGTSETRSYPPTHPSGGVSGRTWTFLVERAAPHRVVRFERDDGLSAALVAAKRIPYWTMNGPGGEAALFELGLEPRRRRTP